MPGCRVRTNFWFECEVPRKGPRFEDRERDEGSVRNHACRWKRGRDNEEEANVSIKTGKTSGQGKGPRPVLHSRCLRIIEGSHQNGVIAQRYVRAGLKWVVLALCLATVPSGARGF